MFPPGFFGMGNEVSTAIGFLVLNDANGNPVANAPLYYRMVAPPSDVSDVPFDREIHTALSGDDGKASVSFSVGGRYQYWTGDGKQKRTVVITSDLVSPFALDTILD